MTVTYGYIRLHTCAALHEVSQNPRIASSIGATQHTQISRGGTMLWPILRLEACPMRVPSLGVFLDVVQVGRHTAAPYANPLAMRRP